jgi:hypothetical protein
MGGDYCHHRDFLEGFRRDIGVSVGPGGQTGFHEDPEDARATISKTKILHSNPEVLVVLAHDANIDGCIPLYPDKLNGGVRGT